MSCGTNCVSCKKYGKGHSYVPLHGHSTYSVGDGVTKIEDIMKRVKEIGSDACAITEHGNLMSFFKFYKAAKKNDIKPILGCELYQNDLFYDNHEKFLELKRSKLKRKKKFDENDVEIIEEDNTIEDSVIEKEDEFNTDLADNSHFLVYAKNYEGLKNIIHLSNGGFENFYRKPLVSDKLIRSTLNENNIITTGCLNSEFSKLILKGEGDKIFQKLKTYKEQFGEDFYLEIHINGLKEQNAVNNYYVEASKALDIKPVFALDYHYGWKDDWYIQYLLYCIKDRKTINTMTEDDWFYGVRNLYIKEIDEIYKMAEENGLDKKFLEQAIDSTFDIRDKTNIEIPLYENNFPKFIIENKKSSNDFFSEKLEEKWIEKINNGLIPKDEVKIYRERLEYEKEIILSKGFVDYFLILDDLLNNFVYKNGGASGAGRGSAGGCLILFILDVTKIDPVRHNLIFERFMNPDRLDPPDVDIDLDSKIHKQVEDYLKNKYGIAKVCHISNFSKFGPKSIVKDLCRVFEMDYYLSNKLTGLFGKFDRNVSEELIAAKDMAIKMQDQQLMTFIDDNFEKLSQYGDKMIGMIRQVGRHASGILISNNDLNISDIPINRSKGELITGVQEGMEDREVSELGYLKLDILGLTNASVINETMKLIENKYGIKDLENTLIKSQFDHQPVWDEFAKGNCLDIFQFGSDGMVEVIKDIAPKNIYELCAINALYRPANIEAGMIKEYKDNRNNPERAEARLNSIYSGLWDLLKETFGAICYQEQVMFVLQEVGGFTLGEADSVRKLLKTFYKVGSENITDKKFTDMINKFESGAIKKGVSKNNAHDLLKTLSKYTGYTFNKSHSFAYSVNAYISMYLKTEYPLEYFATLFNYSDNEEIFNFFKLSKSHNINYNEFVCNKSAKYFEVDYNTNAIKIGLNCVKGMQTKDVDKILNIEINTLDELLTFTKEQKFGKKAIETLCRLEYFKYIFENAKGLELLMFKYKTLKKKEIDLVPEWIEEAKHETDYTVDEKLQFQKEYLGFYLSEHPFITFKEYLDSEYPDELLYSPSQLKELHQGDFSTYGIVNSINIKKTKKGKEYFQLVLEDDASQINVNIWDQDRIANLQKGNKILFYVSKNAFGYNLKNRILKI
jgi:DNA polymerase-3 subunit alpha